MQTTIYNVLLILSMPSMIYCMQNNKDPQKTPKNNDIQITEFPQSPTSTSKNQLNKSKSQKTTIKSNTQLNQEIKNRRLQMLSDSSCSTSEKKG